MQTTSLVIVATGVLALQSAGCSKETNVDASGGDGPDASVAPDAPDCSEAGPAPGIHGPNMVRAGRMDGTCFWIDVTEITRAQYDTFLASNPPAQVESPCTHNDSFEPSCEPLDSDAGSGDDGGTGCADNASMPVVCVDWCDAAAYCAWAGKVLCEGDYDDAANASTSSWYAACSSGDVSRYPYGKAYDASTCRGAEFGGDGCAGPAGELESCSTPAGALDMSGNVAEWVDACKNPGNNTGECRYRGGHFNSEADRLSCDSAQSELMVPQMKQGKLHGRRPYIGFRCCAYEL